MGRRHEDHVFMPHRLVFPGRGDRCRGPAGEAGYRPQAGCRESFDPDSDADTGEGAGGCGDSGNPMKRRDYS